MSSSSEAWSTAAATAGCWSACGPCAGTAGVQGAARSMQGRYAQPQLLQPAAHHCLQLLPLTWAFPLSFLCGCCRPPSSASMFDANCSVPSDLRLCFLRFRLGSGGTCWSDMSASRSQRYSCESGTLYLCSTGVLPVARHEAGWLRAMCAWLLTKYACCTLFIRLQSDAGCTIMRWWTNVRGSSACAQHNRTVLLSGHEHDLAGGGAPLRSMLYKE